MRQGGDLDIANAALQASPDEAFARRARAFVERYIAAAAKVRARV
jgi:hypothetical protein